MTGPEDTGSRTVEDAARFERWRARNYDVPVEAGSDTYRRCRPRKPQGCRCHSASETPCDHCAGGP